MAQTPRLAAGDKAPAFSLADADEKKVSLADYRGRKVIVYFYPAASTPGCTKEACDFRDNLHELNKAGLVGSLWSFNIVDSIYLVTKGGPADATTTAPVFIYGKAFNQFQASDAAAVSVITIILLAAVAFFYIRVAKPKEDA